LFGRRGSSDAANAMRLYQKKRKIYPDYTLAQAWKEIRSHRTSHRTRRPAYRFGSTEAFGTEVGTAGFGTEVGTEVGTVDTAGFGTERSSDLSFGEDEHKVAFGRPSFGRPHLTM
jgi:hypothetical protein